ncbi:MAG: hypothetical protein GY737_08145 [Desulfobacteraceae bacterium]|nr:hypothetical protein [Desulfobacteraceae bacterium]
MAKDIYNEKGRRMIKDMVDKQNGFVQDAYSHLVELTNFRLKLMDHKQSATGAQEKQLQKDLDEYKIKVHEAVDDLLGLRDTLGLYKEDLDIEGCNHTIADGNNNDEKKDEKVFFIYIFFMRTFTI